MGEGLSLAKWEQIKKNFEDVEKLDPFRHLTGKELEAAQDAFVNSLTAREKALLMKVRVDVSYGI